MAEKPTAAFVLSLIGGIIYLLVGIIVAAAAAFIGSIVGLAGYGVGGLAVASVGAIGLVSGILMLVGAVMMNSSNKSKVRTGSVLVLLFTLIGALFTLGGFLIGFILGLIGSIMGLVWKPSEAMPPPPPPPM
ncbi:MAG TPA: hypothetical protein VGR56_00420 [Nitrososphaerales archaeon]|nr:hypothetical protein [Nitrososphaerales archaeon]